MNLACSCVKSSDFERTERKGGRGGGVGRVGRGGTLLGGRDSVLSRVTAGTDGAERCQGDGDDTYGDIFFFF